jgi:prohibitin 2
MNLIVAGAIGIVTLIIIASLIILGVVTINAGNVGVLLTWGNADPTPLEPGLHFISPIGQSVQILNVQTQLSSQTAEAATSDLQDVSATVAINYHINPADAAALYIHLGPDYANKIIAPAVQESIKQVAAHFSAAELITKRADAKAEATTLIAQRLANYNIVLDTLSITNFSFSPTFTEAIEAKVTAVQHAEQEENNLVTAKIIAQQAVASANGTATSIKLIEAQLEQSPYYVHYLIATKWDGHLPKVTGGGGIPLLSLSDINRNDTTTTTTGESK